MAEVTKAPNRKQPARETAGQGIRRRRLALGMSVRELAREAEINRATVTGVEADHDGVRETSVARLQSVLTRLEQAELDRLEQAAQATQQPESGEGNNGSSRPPAIGLIKNTIVLSDGTKVEFVGSPDGVAEAALKFLASRPTLGPSTE